MAGPDLNSQRDSLIAMYQSGADMASSRALVVRAIGDDAALRAAQYNRAFVLVQYFGYLQRDIDQGGYDFWVNVLNNGAPNDYRGMVCAFVSSGEYQHRFATITHGSQDCQ